ncbi:22271_t:CDS:1, partial [Racocetra persica]
ARPDLARKSLARPDIFRPVIIACQARSRPGRIRPYKNTYKLRKTVNL